MDCSASQYLSTACDREGMKILVQFLSSEDRYIIHRRLEILTGETKEVNVSTLCPVHAEQVYTEYNGVFYSRTFVEEEIQEAYSKAVRTFNLKIHGSLKVLQAETIHKMLCRKHLFVVLPTSYGKTIAGIVSSLVRAIIIQKRIFCLVVSPLRTLSEQLKQLLIGMGLICHILQPDEDEFHTITSYSGIGVPVFLVASPEVLQTHAVRTLLSQVDVDQVVIDEAHTVTDWGETFRKAFLSLNNLSDVVQCPFAMFSATIADIATYEKLLNYCGLQTSNVTCISASPDRPEIFIRILGRTSDAVTDLKFIADDFNTNGVNMKRTIIFLNSVDGCAQLNLRFRRLLKDNGKYRHINGKWEYVTDHFYAEMGVQTRKSILKRFSDSNSMLKILFATVGYGLGVDNKLIRRVVIWDNEPSASQLWQKIGRCSRDGSKGEAVVFTSQTAKGCLYGKTGCIRNAILSNMIGYTEETKSCVCSENSSSPECTLIKCCISCANICKGLSEEPIYETVSTAGECENSEGEEV